MFATIVSKKMPPETVAKVTSSSSILSNLSKIRAEKMYVEKLGKKKMKNRLIFYGTRYEGTVWDDLAFKLG
ncbi:hypothetical protein L1987_47927 [Smallanthus sonchifolius]|uniref:Uncharacterized protein n=1 Tax=Smallanthus sonchifolius TaxID=185202 RepID=A0ACB9FQK1_9ASTR|nr:hypothetical protein L1987_47927 [Smallanthus sonchifolius]